MILTSFVQAVDKDLLEVKKPPDLQKKPSKLTGES